MKTDDTTETVTLRPVAMMIPTRQCIYSPSNHCEQIEMPHAEFLRRLADGGQAALYNPDPKPKPQNIWAGSQRVTAYLDARNWQKGWFVVVPPDTK